MKILLIRPKPNKETIGLQNVMICEPLELEYICSYLEPDGHEINIIDMILEQKSVSFFVRHFNPDVVAFTAYISHVNVVKEYANQVKKTKKHCKVAVGGVHAEVVPEDFEDCNIDFIIQGNGLKTFKEIINSLELSVEDFSSIEGVWSQENTRCAKEACFNYPIPNRSKVQKYRHKYYYMFHNPCALMKTSFGCPYSCNFCFCRAITDGKYFVRDLSEVIEEIKTIAETEIYIVDDDFLVDSKRILTFCRLLKENELNKKFLIYGRADFIADNEEVILEFAKCGLRAVIVGLESCNQEELKKYNKKSSVDINERAIAVLKRANVECYATLMLGIDWTNKDFNNLYRWIKKLDLNFINLQPFTPLPGTTLFEEYREKLLVPKEEYAKWDLAHLVVSPERMSLRWYYLNIIKMYYKITMNPKNLYRMIKLYGLKQNIKLSIGASKITWQYIKKIIYM